MAPDPSAADPAGWDRRAIGLRGDKRGRQVRWGYALTVEVALFIPCYVDQLAPGVGLAALGVLDRVGCRVSYDPSQTCCGQPFLNLGRHREATRLARSHVARFKGAEAVVSPSASCVATVRHHFGELGEGLEGAGRETRQRTFELGEFLVRRLGRTELGARFAHRVAILPSCHGLRELGLGSPSEQPDAGPSDTTRTLLEEVEGLELCEPERADECCGFGGAFSVGFPEISARMGRDRLRRLAATGAEYVTSTDVSCLMHLGGLRAREGFGPRPIHLAEILAARTEL
jgi:L-lactate dehydrogenase complex protein LldE